MLVDNTFLFLSIPRTSTYSFLFACGKCGLDVKHLNSEYNSNFSKIDWNQTNDILLKNVDHRHETLVELEKKFGKNYEIISIKRNPYERFLSMWKFVIDKLYYVGEDEIADILARMDSYSVFDFRPRLLDSIAEYNSEFIIKFKEKYNLIPKYNSTAVDNSIRLVYTPPSMYHNHDDRIIWFDFNKLYELEEWVSNKLNIDFKLENTNTSKHINCNLKLDNTFIERYNHYYLKYELQKQQKTIL